MTEPYYSDDRVTLYLGDCRDVTEWLAADVLVTDPPYGMAYVSNRSKHGGPSAAIAGDADATIRDAVLALWGTRPALVFGTWRVPRPTAARWVGVWDKGDDPGPGDLGFPWGPSWEEWYVLGDGWRGKRGPSVIRSNRLGGASADRPDHPTPKPVSLMERLIEKSPPGLIADPFAGSGATLLAARNLGRNVVGVEVDERYCETIARRLSQDCLDLASL